MRPLAADPLPATGMRRRCAFGLLPPLLALATAGGALAQTAPQPFRIDPVRPVAELLEEARRVPPPRQPAGLRASELVELTALDPTIRLDVRYATANNFLGAPVYRQARAFLQRPAAQALVRAQRSLAGGGLGVIVYDGYRPWSVTWVFWQATPPGMHEFVADPAAGSIHNRGCAVDLGLVRLADGVIVEMPGGYDEMTERSHVDYGGGTTVQRAYRDLLRRTMEAVGFTAFRPEWWHYDHRDWRLYPVANVPMEDIARARPVQ
jgi:zinc D-Ala-D-Ala dipeptidase